MSSEKQILANRRNAQKACGPVSETGKARSRLNALKHGAFARKLLLPDEKPAELARFERMYLEHYQPPTEMFRTQVLALAMLAWRLRRYGQIEAEILTAHGYAEVAAEPGKKVLCFEGPGWGFTLDCSNAKSLQALSMSESRRFREFMKLKEALDDQLGPAVVRQPPNASDQADSPPILPEPDV